MDMKNLCLAVYFTALAILLFTAGCNTYKAQKTPWPVGKTPLYWQNGSDRNAVLTVTKVWHDDDIYDGDTHFRYDVVDAKGEPSTGIMDYALGEHKAKKSVWVWLRADGTKDSTQYEGSRDTMTMSRPTADQLKLR
jgi:hypothetical protein